VTNRFYPVQLILLFLTACSTPSELIRQQAESHGFQPQIISSNLFIHAVYKKKTFCADNTVHVYIPGDGNPWRSRHRVALDPTPRYSLMLDLMALDNVASTQYLGRPCYLGQYKNNSCHALHWTHWRYSEDVVSSLQNVLHQQLSRFPECKATLIGYSGGGTLAMLIAPQLPQVSTVITIAGNLNVNAWSKMHAYSPLQGSLDPAEQLPLPSRIKQWHLLGGMDDNVPASISRQVIQDQPNAEILYFDKFTHQCCWKAIWPSVLKKINNAPE
tara:strand:- start:94 stop:909 length:816 start_codon:yes stop_codon:yes gene_type:complete